MEYLSFSSFKCDITSPTQRRCEGGTADFQLNKIRRCANREGKAIASDWVTDAVIPPGTTPNIAMKGLGLISLPHMYEKVVQTFMCQLEVKQGSLK